MSGRHTEPRRRGESTHSWSFGSLLPLLTVLVVCVITASVVTLGVRHQHQQPSGASLRLTSQRPLLPPLKKHLVRGQSAAHQAGMVSRSLVTPRGEGTTTKAAAPQPQKVV